MEQKIRKAIRDLLTGKIPESTIQYIDYKSDCYIVNPKITVDIRLTNGKVATLDVTEYFKEDVK